MVKITNIKEGTDKNNNPMKICELDNGKTAFVNSKYNADIYELVKVDSEVEVQEENGFTKIKPESFGLTPKPKFGGGVKVAQERKEKSIEKSQDRKENGIVLSSTARDATGTARDEMKADPDGFDREKYKALWLFWRGWYIDNAGNPKDITETKEPF